MKKSVLLLSVFAAAASFATSSVDFSNYVRAFRRELHGAGYSPQHYPRADYNMDADVKAMGFYSTRTHNWAIYNCAQRVCDLGLVFPCADMDPDDRSAYYFDATDQVIDLATSSAAGSMQVFYTLGNSTDYAGDVAFNGAIPTNYLNTAKTMANVVRHYNQGWNSGKSKGITYWEIWSSPDDCKNYWYREGLTDTQLMNEFATFFATCLKHLKTQFPYYKFGGPGLTTWNTTWLTAILNACAAEGVEPDFISWHCYTDNVTGLTGQPATARAWLDQRGYTNTKLIIDEWHYLPNNSWNGITKYATTKSYVAAAHDQRYYKNCAWGIDSGVFNTAVLSRLQYTDLDRAFFYGNGYTGIGPSSTWAYQDYYTDKNKNYYSMVGFGDIAKVAKRLYGATNDGSVTVMAATDAAGTKGYLVVSDYQGTSSSVSVKINGITGASNFTAKRLAYGYNSYNLDSITPTYSSGTLTMSKGAAASAAFFVTFDVTGVTVPHQHTWGSWSTTTAATCTTAGTRTRSCTASGCTSPVATQTGTIPPLGHSETADAKVSPTCTAAGHTAGIHCSRCNAVIVPTEPIPALGHDPVEVEALAPTATAAGHTAGVWCSRCHLVISGVENIPPTGIPTELPSGYVPVSYIEGTGTQYIDTGVTVKDQLSAKVDFAFTSINPSGPYMLAANALNSSSSRDNRAYFATVNASGVWRGGIGSASLSTFPGIDAATVGTRYLVESSINGASYSISVSNCVSHTKQSASATYAALSAQPSDKPTTLTLFALYTSTICYFTSAKLYGCEIWTGTDLTRKYVPCYQKSGGRYGLYDLIGNRFYGSNSETEFIGPPMNVSITPTGISDGELSFSISGLSMDMMFVAAYGAADGGETLNAWANASPIGVLPAGTTSHSFTLPSGWGTDYSKLRIFALLPNAVPAAKLEYITADQAGKGSSTPQYIDTGCIPTNTTYCSVDVKLSDVTVQSRVFESKWIGSNYLAFHAYINGNGYPAFACADSSVSSPWTEIQTSALVSTSKRAEWIVSPKDAKSYYNVNGGTSYEKSISTTRTRNGGGTIRLLWSSGNPSGVGDLYGSVIKKNNVVIRRFVPAKCYADATTQVAGLYDTVNSRFYASAGTAEFVAGPEASDSFTLADFSKAASYGCSDVVQGAVHEHVWSDWVTNVAVTCTVDGMLVRTCSASGCPQPAQTNYISRLGHHFGSWYTYREAQIGVEGETRRDCTRCDYYESQPIPALSDPGCITTNEMADASWGYEIHGLGAASNEVAMVYTNCTKTMTMIVPQGVESISYLLVGGGGAGGAANTGTACAGAGGGAGGYITGTTNVVPNVVISFEVGAGGSADNGGATVIRFDGTDIANVYGGGRGGNGYGDSGRSGGSGGGSGWNVANGGTGIPGLGNNGGGCVSTSGYGGGGGGGGAGEAGTKNTTKTGAKGGNGLMSDITGTSIYYAGGGGGGGRNDGGASGGLGGGGKGGAGDGNGNTAKCGSNGVNGLGGGGGGSGRGYTSKGGKGGSGIVVLRFVDINAEPAHVHTWSDVWTTNTVPTCTTPGERFRVCTSSECSVPPAAQTNAIDALGHDWGEWQTITEPTQDDVGLKRRTCQRTGCNASEDAEIPSLSKTWNILMIGNSFSLQINNSSYPFGVSSRLLGKKVNVYNLYSGGCPLQKHWDNHATKGKYGSIQYDLEDNPGVHQYSDAQLADTSLDTMLELRDWDVVTLQQASTSSPYLSSYEPYLGNLINLIRSKAPHAEIVFHQTWAYDRESAVLSNKPFNGDVANREWMYDELTSNITSLCSTYGLRIIPVGLAAQLYRYQKPVRTFNEDPCYSDHQHFNSDFKYMQLLVWLKFFWGELPPKAQMVTVPDNSSEEALMRSVANQAVAATDLTQYGQGTVDWSYNVTFNTWDNHLIEVQSVTNGASALPPSPGTRDGMTFVGWKSSYGTDSSATVSTRKVFNPVTYTASWTFDEDPDRVYTTNDMANADWGYEIHGLGDASNEVAYVFTSETAAMEWTVPDGVTSVRYLVVGGGGGGGSSYSSGTKGGGGGGAGGLLRGSFSAVAGDKLYLKVGAGGSGSSAGGVGSSGKNSSVTNLSSTVSQIAIGGGYGGAGGGTAGATGGSSGGANTTGSAPKAATSGQGNKGGTGITATGGGGGGGAGAPGEDAVADVCAGAGGTGLSDDITGKWKYYAAGGGGGSASAYTRGAGGYGGGGNGGKGGNGSNATGYGCGGGAGTYGGKVGGNGSKGIIVLRCAAGVVPPPEHEHVWGEWTTNVAATCTTAGERTRSCTASGCTDPVATQTEPIAVLGHDLGDWYTFKAAEVGVAGEKRRACSRCDYYESEEIPALPDPHGGDAEPFGTNAMSNASWGYEIHGLGAANNEVALVFTNTTFTSASPMEFELPSGVTTFQYLVVGGGASGGVTAGNTYVGCGGGGAGALLDGSYEGSGSITLGVSVGNGGASVWCNASGNASSGNNGVSSVLKVNGVAYKTAKGGGCGGRAGAYALNGGSSGSGGGAGGGYGTNTSAAKLVGGTATEGGNNGGAGAYHSSAANNNSGGGGGGAGGVGGSADNAIAGAGGAGVQRDITGAMKWYAAGGGGGACKTGTRGAGGIGGGGAGGASGGNGGNATAYGCGGGGASGSGGNDSTGRRSGAGKQGVVIIRYMRAGGGPLPAKKGIMFLLK